MNGIPINVAKALPMIQEMIKTEALAKEIGRSGAWIHNKLNHNVINNKEQEFNAADLEMINRGVQDIGNRLLQTYIVYSENRDEVIAQVKPIASTVMMTYIYNTILGKGQSWYLNRTKKTLPLKNSSFSEDDVLSLNMAIREIGNKLLSIEIIL